MINNNTFKNNIKCKIKYLIKIQIKALNFKISLTQIIMNIKIPKKKHTRNHSNNLHNNNKIIKIIIIKNKFITGIMKILNNI